MKWRTKGDYITIVHKPRLTSAGVPGEAELLPGRELPELHVDYKLVDLAGQLVPQARLTGYWGW